MNVRTQADAVVRDLFAASPTIPSACRRNGARDWTALEHDRRARRVADYIAGMTDRYALDEHRRLFDATPDLR